MVIFTYVVAAVLVGILGVKQRGGFLFYFVLSIVASPLVGLIILILLTPSSERHRTT